MLIIMDLITILAHIYWLWLSALSKTLPKTLKNLMITLPCGLKGICVSIICTKSKYYLWIKAASELRLLYLNVKRCGFKSEIYGKE